MLPRFDASVRNNYLRMANELIKGAGLNDLRQIGPKVDLAGEVHMAIVFESAHALLHFGSADSDWRTLTMMVDEVYASNHLAPERLRELAQEYRDLADKIMDPAGNQMNRTRLTGDRLDENLNEVPDEKRFRRSSEAGLEHTLVMTAAIALIILARCVLMGMHIPIRP